VLPNTFAKVMLAHENTLSDVLSYTKNKYATITEELKFNVKAQSESPITALGGMARIKSMKDYFSCPPWISAEKWLHYRDLYTKASQGVSALIQIDLELADNCNYKCIECPISDDQANRSISYLSDTDILEILSSARDSGALALKLNYINEPLLDVNKLLRTAKLASDLGFVDIYFTTNGSMMKSDVSELLIKSQLFSRIQVSLDAINPETYSLIRRGGNLARVMSNIQSFLDLRIQLNHQWPKIRVSLLSLPENLQEQQAFYDYWIDKVDAVALQSSVLKPNTSRDNHDNYQNLRSTYCPNPHRQLVVRANKSVLPCCSFWGESIQLGSYENFSSLTEAFDCKKMKTLQKSFTFDGQGTLHQACISCLSSCDPAMNG